MTDIATRVYNHQWRIDPIVRSVLDTDFYKLLMAQTIFRRHKDAQVTFGIINRTRKVRIADLVDEVFGDVEVDVGLDESDADLAEGVVDVLVGEGALAAQGLEGAL